MPLAESLIDMKVSEYRDRLLGVHIPTTTTITNVGSPITINGGAVSSYTCLD